MKTWISPGVTATTLILVMAACMNTPSPLETGFLNRTVADGDSSARYQVYVPTDYSSDREWPVILFLHGSGERGSDGLKQTDVGLGRAIRLHPERWPAIVVFPQAPDQTLWNEKNERLALRALNQTLDEYSTDRQRILLTGLSMGGYGSLYLASKYPDLFAAVAAVCPSVGEFLGYPLLFGSNLEEATQGVASALKDVPLWLFHGDEDRVLPASVSRNLASALEARSGRFTYTEFENTGHNSWDQAYADSDFIDWFFSQSTPSR
ncbi:MAG: alpha/beta hydrolase-fold protein [Bacteroidota bacterium]|nr:alpha/beta hydrolase-fold protein [Bacteroidota bacterium]